MDATFEMLLFNIDDGFMEGVSRGIRGGLLSTSDYANLSQCDNLEGRLACATPRPRLRAHTTADIKMHLQGTKYGAFLANEPPPLTTTTIQRKATEKMVEEFKALRSQSNQPLSKFLDYITYGYMVR